jgi:misacylated tRNA(Ala) deacylase
MARVYEQDSYCKNLETRVLSCTPSKSGFEVILEDELLFPEGGGQPADFGTIANQPVLSLSAHEGRVVHRVTNPVSGIVAVQLDWPRRFDHMQQHTGQHVITATALKHFQLRTTAFHIGPTLCDIEFDTPPLSADALEALEARVNEVVRQALPITIEAGSTAEIESGALRSRRLAKGVTGPLRIVTIKGFDRNTCGGTHLANTAELQLVKLVGTERLTRSFRIFYATGERVRHLTTAAMARSETLNHILSCGPDQHVAAIRKLQDEARAAQKLAAKRTEELATAIAAELATSTAASRHLPDADPGFLRTIAQAFRAQQLSGRVFLTAGSDSAPSRSILIAGPPDWVTQHAPAMAALLDARGGGRDGLYQGKASNFSNLPLAISYFLHHD